MEPLNCYSCNAPSDYLAWHYVGRQNWGQILTIHYKEPLLCPDCVEKHGDRDCNETKGGETYCQINEYPLPLRRPNYLEERLHQWLKARLNGMDIPLEDVMSNEARRYVDFSKEEFEQAISDAGVSQLQESEPRWTRNRVGVEVCECRYWGRLPGVKGYVSIGSSIDPSSELANDNSCDRITLTFTSGDKKFFKRLNRVQNWKVNLAKAIEGFEEIYTSSLQPTDLSSSNSGCQLTASNIS